MVRMHTSLAHVTMGGAVATTPHVLSCRVPEKCATAFERVSSSVACAKLLWQFSTYGGVTCSFLVG